MPSETFDTTESCALQLDEKDPLRSFRDRFFIPSDTIYVDGNSLGLLSKDAEQTLHRVINEWKTLAIKGWLDAKQPWFYFSEVLGKRIAPFVGAEPDEVVATGTTTVNLHSLVSTFYSPKGSKTKILADELDFPSDLYALRSQIRLKGLDPAEELVLVPSEDGRTLDEQTIIEYMTDDIALILLPSVLYRSGQLLDIPLLTSEAHKRDILIGYDCSHSVGAIPHSFDQNDVDFAFWCSYKYLNSGPGSSAYLYVNKKHFNRQPGLVGWFGNKKSTQFEMNQDFESAQTAGAWQISSPGIIGAAAMEGALNVITEAGIEQIRQKSLKLTSYFMFLIDEELSQPPYNFNIGNPREPKRRGGHVALEHQTEAYRIATILREHGVIPDFRPPNIIRIAPIALYNTFHEIWCIVQLLKQIIDKKEYENISPKRTAIS
jgi:kynureninase